VSQADEIREYTYSHFIKGVEIGNSIKIRAGDVHRDMGFQNRIPNVCSVLDGKKLADEFGLELVNRTGPNQGANAYFTFVVLSNRPTRQVRTRKVTENSTHQSRTKQSTPISDNTNLPLPRDAICLVSCVGKKRSERIAAKDLYISDWFLKARCFVEEKRFQWFILSAEHGLIHPDQMISPYEKTLNTMGVKDRRDWARKVLGQIEETIPKAKSFIFLAGQRYRENLVEPLRQKGSEIHIPMEGLTIGRQLSWLQAQV
tara:strand:- start:22 stop:795 length:774 start_codon:yes stop_codon:yes gene_type:complete